MSKDITAACQCHAPLNQQLARRSKTNQKHVAKIRQSDGVGMMAKQFQVAAASNPKYCSEYAPVNSPQRYSKSNNGI
jgi:hypothetical protein